MPALVISDARGRPFRDCARLSTWSIGVCLLISACGGRALDVVVTQVPAAPLPVQMIEGAPVGGAAVDRIEVGSAATPSRLSSMGGLIAVGTAVGVFIGSTTQPNSLSAVPVLADSSGPQSTGAVLAMARRSSGGLLVYAQNGLFHDSQGSLLLSPLTQALAGGPLSSLDVYGAGTSEELWMVLAGQGAHAAGGQLVTFQLGASASAPDAVVGVDAGSAVVVQDGIAYLLELDQFRATPIAEGLGRVAGFDRSDDGSVYLATQAGLLQRSRTGDVSLRTFAPSGSPAVSVLAVSAAYGSVVAETSQWLVRIDASGAAQFGPAGGVPPVGGVAVDANGDTWSAGQDKLFRVLTGKPVSFAGEVRPFFDLHCMFCHRTGAQGSPVRNFDDFDTAKSMSPLILRRLQASGIQPMPPAYVETLTAADYAVVIRWIGGGLQP